MYCPGCAAQNAENTKFCRACGTNLEAVSLALAGQHNPAELKKEKAKKEKTSKSWAQKQSEGARDAVHGSILLTTAVLIGVAFALFTKIPDWIVIWTIFFGWLAGWGVVSLASGVGRMLEAKTMLRHLEDANQTARSLTAADPRELPVATSFPVLSVTEQTTEPLRIHQSESEQST